MTFSRELGKAIFDGVLTDQEPPYREHAWLVNRGSLQPPSSRRATATSFSGWVYGLCHAPRSNRQLALERGKSVERRVHEQRTFARSLRRDYPVSKDLEVIFEDPLDDSVNPLQASALTVDGRPLQCVPDRVLENKKTKEVFIFENKSTPYTVPVNGWPNLKVQLWCYSWIDRWLNAPEVYLVGAIWIPKDGQWVQSSIIPRWSRNDRYFCAECSELFELFGGVATPPHKTRRAR